MEETKMKSEMEKGVINRDILFSKTVKAGKRIYYLDVKENRKGDLFLAVTESKKVITGEGDESKVRFEKHKIFLYKEDFEKFMQGMNETINFIYEKEGPYIPQQETIEDLSNDTLDGDIEIDLDF
ncbi:MAG: PUR family DNA/RNA-binding protein [Bacteroidales bacterium]|nr:PUR family DNA/RNA-binding protein [Bacteroidales bacterium]